MSGETFRQVDRDRYGPRLISQTRFDRMQISRGNLKRASGLSSTPFFEQ